MGATSEKTEADTAVAPHAGESRQSGQTAEPPPRNAQTPVRAVRLEPIRQRRNLMRLMRIDRSLPTRLAETLWSDPDGLLTSGTMLKDDRRCTVVRLDFGDRQFVLKRYNLRGPLHTAGHLFLQSRASRCWRFGRKLIQAGVRTPRPLACLEHGFGPLRTRSFLLTEFIPGRSLRDHVDRPGGPFPVSRKIAEEFARLWHRLGALRFTHGDMKSTNFLVSEDERLWAIDLDGMRQHRFAATWTRGRTVDWNRFLRDWKHAPQASRAFRSAVGRFGDLVSPHSSTSRGAVGSSECTASACRSERSGFLWIEPAIRPLLENAGLTDFEAITRDTRNELLRRLPDRENLRLNLADETGAARRMYLKWHRSEPGRQRPSWSNRRKPTAGRLEAQRILEFQQVGLPTMSLVAVGERPGTGSMPESLLVTDELAGYTQLDDYLEERFRGPAPNEDVSLRALIRRVAGVASQFHRLGYNHRDFYCCHFFVRETVRGRFDVRLIDLQRVQHRQWWRRRWLIKDLAQLAYSAGRRCIGRRERMLFIKSYLGVDKLSSSDKRFIRRILRREWRMERKLGPYK